MECYDCIVVGGGPGGLTATMYLARFLCKTLLIDNKDSRAALIPKSHNFPAFPNGISGTKLLARMREQCLKYQPEVCQDTVIKIKKSNSFFLVQTKRKIVKTKYVILATGVLDIEPALPNLRNAIKTGLIRHCLVCDGYEVRNKKIALIGQGKQGFNEAIALSRYSCDITLFTLGNKLQLTQDEKKLLKEKKIIVVSDDIKTIALKNQRISSFQTSKDAHLFDTVYSALGTKVRSELAIQIGARIQKCEKITVDTHQQTSINGLYAVGDLVPGLNQISIAIGQAAVAATHIFNKIRQK